MIIQNHFTGDENYHLIPRSSLKEILHLCTEEFKEKSPEDRMILVCNYFNLGVPPKVSSGITSYIDGPYKMTSISFHPNHYLGSEANAEIVVPTTPNNLLEGYLLALGIVNKGNFILISKDLERGI